jgi:hypothetical protein
MTTTSLLRSRHRAGRARALLTAAAAAAGLALSAGSADAVTFCVNLDPCSGGTAKPDIETALQQLAANGTHDQLKIGEGTYVGNFAYSSSEKLTITGAGEGRTVLLPGSGGPVTLGLDGSDASVVERLTIGVKDASGGRGLVLGARAREVTVRHDGASDGVIGVRLRDGSSLYRVRIESGSNTWAVERDTSGGAASITETEIDAPRGFGIYGGSGGLTVTQTRITVRASAVSSSGATTLTNVLAHTLATNGTAPAIQALSGAHLVADHVTAYGSGAGHGFSLSAAQAASTMVIRNSVAENFQFQITRSNDGSAHPANMTISYSRYPYVRDLATAGTLTEGPGKITDASRFADAAAGDFRPAWDSPLIDAGDPASSVTDDLHGDSRPVDGDGDGVARSDIGAVEYRRRAPEIAFLEMPGTAPAGQAVAMAAGADDRDGDPCEIAWDFGDGTPGATGDQVTHAFDEPGTYTVVATVTDASGETGSVSAQVVVTAAAGSAPTGEAAGSGGAAPGAGGAGGAGAGGAGGAGAGGAGGAGAGGAGSGQGDAGSSGGPRSAGRDAADRTAPEISALRAARRVRSGSARTTLVRRTRGAALSFRLSEAATIRLRLERRAGRRWVRAGTIRLRGRRGLNAVRFAGRLSATRRLARGRIRVTVVAVDAAGNAGAPRTVTMRLV